MGCYTANLRVSDKIILIFFAIQILFVSPDALSLQTESTSTAGVSKVVICKRDVILNEIRVEA
jgi:hypothetical protein